MTNTPTYDGPIWRRGKKTLLCPVHESDLPHFTRMINDAEMQKFVSVTWPLGKVSQQQWFERVSQADPNNITVSVRTFAGELIGDMSIRFDQTKRTAETGSLIGISDFHGHGFGTDAKMTLLEYAFNTRDTRKVVSHILGYNIRSRRYAKKCGYRFTACLPREHFRFGKWRSEVIYTCWREEWLPLWADYQRGS